jgi:Uma2 family endonuclease
MTTKPALDLATYLVTAFHDHGCEFVDGEVVLKPVPDIFHSLIEASGAAFFANLRMGDRRLYSAIEVGLLVEAQRVRLPDVAVFLGFPEISKPLKKPPFIAIEILSDDDRMSDVLGKLREYAAFGVEHIWLLDHRRRVFSVFVEGELREVAELRVPGTDAVMRWVDLLPAELL